MASTNVRVSPKLQMLQEAARIQTRRPPAAMLQLALLASCALVALVLALNVAG